MRELKTQFPDRALRFDGVSEVELDELSKFLFLGIPPAKLRVVGSGPELEQFNAQIREEKDYIRTVEPEPINIDLGWQLPKEYMEIDLDEYMMDKLVFSEHIVNSDVDDYFVLAAQRIQDELHEVHTRGMEEFMRTIIFIIDEFKRNDVVWGVGRGSSCASYLLFLLGLHVVDCVKMEVPMEEFYHE